MKKIQIFLGVIAVIALSTIVAWKWAKSPEASPTPAPSQNVTWKTYTNTGHGYRMSYPKEALVAPVAEMERKPLEQSADAYIFIPGSLTQLGVTVYLPYEETRGASLTMIEGQKNRIILPLQKFVEVMHQNQINDPNPSMAGRQIGDIQKIVFAGKKGFSFTLTKGFNEGWGLGYALPDRATFNFIFVENKAGEKLMIHYPLGDAISEQMANSFEFTGE